MAETGDEFETPITAETTAAPLPLPVESELGAKIATRRRRQARESEEKNRAKAVILDIPADESANDRTRALFQTLNESARKEPIVCFRGETDEPFLFEDKEIRITKLLEKKMSQGAKFKAVITYNAADASFHIEDNSHHDWVAETAEIKAEGSGDNTVPDLLDTGSVNSLATTDGKLFAIIKQLIKNLNDDEDESRGICVIIDRSDKLFANGGATPSGNKTHNESQLGSIKDALGYDSPHRIILVDRNDATRENAELRKEILVTAVPALTRDDVARIIDEEGYDPDDELIQLSQGLSVIELRDILNSDEDEDIIQRLKRFKEQAIESATGRLVTCKTDPLRRDQVYMDPAEWEMWEDIAREIKEGNTELLEDLLLVGPPGTGKSARAEALARILGATFLEVNNTSSSGLAGRKEDRVRAIIETAIKHTPCVLFWDEIDKALPRTEGNQLGRGTDNDDAQVQAYLQRMLGSKEMEGVIVVGACNDPQRINEALTRNGRFGKKIAILPPNTLDEKVAIFKAVKNQLNTLNGIDFSDAFIVQAINAMGDDSTITTGADYLAVLKEGRRSEARFNSLEESIIHTASNLDFQKSAQYDESTETAKRHHNATFKPWETAEEQSIDPKLLELANWEASLRDREEVLRDIDARIKAAEKLVSDYNSQKDALAKEITEKAAEIVRLDADKDTALEAADRELSDKQRVASTSISTLEEEISTLEEQKTAIEAEIETAQETVSAATAVKNDLDSYIQALRENARNYLSPRAKEIQEKVEAAGGIVLEINDASQISDLITTPENLAQLDPACLEDHGKTLENLPDFEFKAGIYVVYPDIVEGTFNQTFDQQHDATLNGAQPDEIKKLKGTSIIPPIQLLLYLATHSKHRLFDKMPDQSIRLRSRSIVPDIDVYQGEEPVVGEYYEVGVIADDRDEEKLIIDLNSGNGNDTDRDFHDDKNEGDEGPNDAGKDTSILKAFYIPQTGF